MPLPFGHEPRNLAAALETRIDQPRRLEPRQPRAVVVEMRALAPDRLLPGDAEPFEIFVDRLLVFRPAAHGVDVLDAQEEAPARRAGHLDIDERGERMAEMQIAVRARRESEGRRCHRTTGVTLDIVTS